MSLTRRGALMGAMLLTLALSTPWMPGLAQETNITQPTPVENATADPTKVGTIHPWPAGLMCIVMPPAEGATTPMFACMGSLADAHAMMMHAHQGGMMGACPMHGANMTGGMPCPMGSGMCPMQGMPNMTRGMPCPMGSGMCPMNATSP